MFSYIFDARSHGGDGMPRVGGGVAQLSLFRVGGTFSLGGVEVVPIPVMHGPRKGPQ